jgi:hypothetical protein
MSRNRQPLAIQIGLLIAALFVGVLLDRLIFATNDGSGSQDHATATDGGGAPSQSSTRSSLAPTSASSAAHAQTDVGSSGSTSAYTSSLDSILAEHDGRQRLRDLQAFINRIAPNDYGDALKRIQQISNTNERELASRLLVAQWAQNDPDGALQFAAGNHGFEYVAEDVFQQFAAADFEAALSRAKAMPGTELRYRALRGILGFKADLDPRGALQLAQTLGEFHGQEPLTSAVYRQWAASDPQAAAAQAAADGQTGGWRSPVGSVVQTWAAQDPAAAAKWSLSLPDAQAQERSVAQVMRQWAREDPTAAANWIYSLESGASRDAAVAGLAQSIVVQDPSTALSWIGTITDEATRSRTLQRVSGTVMWRDPENGAALLQAAGLPADQIRGNRRGPGR